MNGVAALLARYAQAQTQCDHEFGRSDCVTFVCDWAREATGRDPLGPWRGRYRSGIGAAEFLEIYGGLEGALDQGLALAGFTRRSFGDSARTALDAGSPKTGDVGLILLMRPICAIRGEGKWIARRRRGLVIQPADAIAVWNVADFI